MTSDVRKSFQRNLNSLLEANEMTQVDLQERLNVSSATTSDWCTGKKVPKMDRIEEIANILGVTSSVMLADEDEAEQYYLHRETQKTANEIHKNKELGILFDAARDASPDDLIIVADLLKNLKRKERGDE